MKKAIKVFDGVSIVFFVLMVLVVVIQVVFRYLFKLSTPWTEELSRLIFIYVGFMGTAIAVREKEMIVVDVVLTRLPPKFRAAFDVAIDVLTFAFFCVVFMGALRMFESTRSTYFQSMPFLSNGWTYLAVIIGMGASLLSLLVRAVERIKGAVKKNA